MKSYSFDPTEFAKLELVLTQAVGFHHQKRSRAELENFQAKFFPLLHDLYYRVLRSKIDDHHIQEMSASIPDPWDQALPSKQAIEILTKIFEA